MHSMPNPLTPDISLETPGLPIRILVVEGTEYAGDLLKESPSMFQIEAARDAKVALRNMRNEFYDAVVVELPNASMSAEDLFRSVIGFDLEQALRMVFIASDLNDPDTRRFLTQAGRPFLIRPVDPDELHEMVLRVALGEDGGGGAEADEES